MTDFQAGDEKVDYTKGLHADVSMIRMYIGLAVVLLAVIAALLGVIAFGDGIQVDVNL